MGVKTVRVMWGEQVNKRAVRRLAAEVSGNWRRAFDCCRLRTLVVG